jgi:hypothetical protein
MMHTTSSASPCILMTFRLERKVFGSLSLIRRGMPRICEATLKLF